MGLFNKIKNMFKSEKDDDLKLKKEEERINEDNSDLLDEKTDEKKSVKVYEKGLSKSRKGFVSKLADLTSRFNKINDEYFDELEEILIMADIGVNTVMDFIDR
jgi:fused signal recognition particle receptor